MDGWRKEPSWLLIFWGTAPPIIFTDSRFYYSWTSGLFTTRRQSSFVGFQRTKRPSLAITFTMVSRQWVKRETNKKYILRLKMSRKKKDTALPFSFQALFNQLLSTWFPPPSSPTPYKPTWNNNSSLEAGSIRYSRMDRMDILVGWLKVGAWLNWDGRMDGLSCLVSV